MALLLHLCCMGTHTQGSGTRTGTRYLGTAMVCTQTYPPVTVLPYRVLNNFFLGTFGESGTVYLEFGYDYGTADI